MTIETSPRFFFLFSRLLSTFLRNKHALPKHDRRHAIRASIIRKKSNESATSWSIDNEIYATVDGGRLFALGQIVGEKKKTIHTAGTSRVLCKYLTTGTIGIQIQFITADAAEEQYAPNTPDWSFVADETAIQLRYIYLNFMQIILIYRPSVTSLNYTLSSKGNRPTVILR